MAKGTRRVLLIGITLATLGTAAAVIFRAWRGKVMPRRDPRMPFDEFCIATADGVSLAARCIHGGGSGAVIVAHPAVSGQRFAPMMDLVEKLAEHFDVYTFDFRGHGASGGRLELNLEGPLEDFRAIVSMVRRSGYKWVGAVGLSLGGMSAFLHAATHDGLDAIAMVGAPPLPPDVERHRRVLPLWALFLRLMGTRFKATGAGGPTPMQAAETFPSIPLLVVHGEKEAFYSREDLDRMLEKLGDKAELWVIEGAFHSELAGREEDLVRWLLSHSPA